MHKEWLNITMWLDKNYNKSINNAEVCFVEVKPSVLQETSVVEMYSFVSIGS